MSWLSGILGLFKTIGGLFDFMRDRRLKREGRMQERVETQAEVIENVTKANKAAVDTGDSDRAKRLRDKYTRD